MSWQGWVQVVRRARYLMICVLAALVPLGAIAQTEEAPERRLDLREVRTLRQQIEKNTALDEELQVRILKLYDETIGALGTAKSDLAQAARFDRERSGVSRIAETLRTELDRSQPEPQVRLPENATAEQAEDALARARSRLGANRAVLGDMERLAGERANNRNEISRRLGALDQEIESLNDELQTVTQRDLHPDLIHATRINLLAGRGSALAKIEKLRAQLELLDVRGILIPGQTDQAQRRVSYSARLVGMLEKTSRNLQRREAAARLLRVRERCRQASERSEDLTDIAAETEEYAVMLWGPEGVVVESEKTTDALAATRKYLSDLDRISQLTRRKFEAFGYRGSITRWWPDIPANFPKPGDVAGTIRSLEQRIPEVQHQLIRFEQERAKSRELADRVLKDLMEKHGEEGRGELLISARKLFDTRRDLLDELIQFYGRFSNQLVEHDTVSTFFLHEREALQSFLYERALWVRSVPRPIIPRPGDTAFAFLWLWSPSNVGEAFKAVFESTLEIPARSLTFLALLGALLGFRRRLRERLGKLAQAIERPGSNTYWATAEALVHTILLAAPLPLALGMLSRILLHANASLYVFEAARALYYLALIAGLLEVSRQLFVPKGLAESHFGWSGHVTRTIYQGLLLPEIAFLPLIYVALHFGMSGFRLSSPPDLQLYNNSLGRIAFVIAMLVLGISLVHLFRPGKKGGTVGAGRRSVGSQRLYMYVYPIITLATFVPAVLAALGFYLTAYLLTYQMLQTLWVAVGLLFFGGLLFRWHTVSRAAALRLAGDGEQAGATGQDLPEMEIQVRHLFRFVVILVGAIGFYTVWAGALPTVQIIKRVQLWPQIALLESTKEGSPSSAMASGKAGEQATSKGATGGEGGAETMLPGIPVPSAGASTGGAGVQPGSSSLTLWELLKSLLSIVITWVLVKNIPGLLELSLQRRTRLDSGARIAFSTLVRYMILILGVSIAFSLLGISWSKIQWLVAALTFGLAFGLQEIVANFVSGLILLTERPVRVGDAVTIGNLMGQVTRIQIRATTVMLWDRSEMVVPNKEFITSKLINWTLSDSKRRIDIPLRVAYGADLEKVKKTLLKVARQHPDVMEDPPPQALLLEFGDDAIKFELRIFVDFGIGLKTKDDLHMGIDRAFRDQGIEFALPRLNIELPSGSGGRGEVPPVPPATKSSD
ncbi:MAG: mechanosensitive ion channel [Acidobacteria bacterium]|nr:mechanosensitive ion channel [Acidobacteriota bacterium]